MKKNWGKAFERTVIATTLITATALVGKYFLEAIVKASTWCLTWLQKGIDGVTQNWTIAVVAIVLLFIGSWIFEYLAVKFKGTIEAKKAKRAQKKAEKKAKKEERK